MTKKELKQKIKEQLKVQAKEIRFGKHIRKPKNLQTITEEQVKNYSGIINRPWRLESLRWSYRHDHLAYCMFFNNTAYERIELVCRQQPSFDVIDHQIKKWESLIDEPEAVCDCA